MPIKHQIPSRAITLMPIQGDFTWQALSAWQPMSWLGNLAGQDNWRRAKRYLDAIGRPLNTRRPMDGGTWDITVGKFKVTQGKHCDVDGCKYTT